jgi:prevent-host-death family protein
MKSVAVFEAKNRFSELVSAVEHGEEITITRHGTPVARLVAFSAPSDAATGQRERVLGALQRMRSLGQSAQLGVPLKLALETGRD